MGTGKKLLGSFTGQNQIDAASDAADTQSAAYQAGIDETKRQFDVMTELLSPYVETGETALTATGNLAGLNGSDAQASAISGIENGAEMQAYTKQGENAILQNASATGGLRGGNTQAALAQFRPQLLASLINQQYSRLGGLTQLGQSSAAGTGSAAISTGNSVAELLAAQGSANAGADVAGGTIYSNLANTATKLGSAYLTGLF